jgi:fumarylacetoacetase
VLAGQEEASTRAACGYEATMNPTNDPALRSFIPVPLDSDFPIQNLPSGVFERPSGGRAIGVAIGELILDLSRLESLGLLAVPALAGRQVFNTPSLNAFLEVGPGGWAQVRTRVSQLLRADEPRLRDDAALREAVLIPMTDARMALPVEIGDYTDFYSSREHASNVGSMFRGPDKALMPNWLHLPVAYHGRASSVVVSATDLRRPCGQTKPEGADAPVFGPSRSLDFELEVGYFIGPGNRLGVPIPAAQALDHVFGMVLVNDWSARDIQAWEYVPLGPFLAKNFGTSISPWVVPLEALEPFRTAGPVQDPVPLPYLRTSGPLSYDIHLEVWLQGDKMTAPERVCASNFKHLYWNIAQQVAHHTITGCNLRPGDLLASGTISGPTPDSYGSLLELSWRGTKPLTVGGEQRTFLQDGDRVTFRGWCQGDGYRVGFGAVTGRILSAETVVRGRPV